MPKTVKTFTMRPLTPKQKKIFEFITFYSDQHGFSPSLEEIAERFGKAISTIHKHVELMKNKGYLQKGENQSRSITPLEKTNSMVQIPLLGIIAAGTPIEPLENPEPVDVPAGMVNNTKDYYALRVKGDSMVDMGILDGDNVLVKHQVNANNGDVVVAITEDGATLKVFKNINGRPVLEPRNKDYPTIYPHQLEIRGKFIGLIRKG